jgi:ubiquinone/menaquinone biosynthesis C-methylase UbiE
MKETVDLYNNTYGNFTDRILAEVRAEAFGKDIGQNSWITAQEMLMLIEPLRLNDDSVVLEVACGSGGPAMFLAKSTRCKIYGVDSNENAIQTARDQSSQKAIHFEVADANNQLPFDEGKFDAIVCMDAVNHLTDRLRTLREWNRLLKKSGRFLYTDPIVVTGPLTNDEVAKRSSIGFFLFVPLGANEKWIEEAGLRLIEKFDVTSAASTIAKRWHDARAKRQQDLESIEGKDRFEGLQTFLDVVHRLYNEKRLSRFAYIGEKI